MQKEESGKNGAEEDRREGEREGERGSAWAALQQQQLQQPVRKSAERRQREEREGCKIDLKEAFSHKEKEFEETSLLSPS